MLWRNHCNTDNSYVKGGSFEQGTHKFSQKMVRDTPKHVGEV